MHFQKQSLFDHFIVLYLALTKYSFKILQFNYFIIFFSILVQSFPILQHKS